MKKKKIERVVRLTETKLWNVQAENAGNRVNGTLNAIMRGKFIPQKQENRT